jgi:8-oxo-dGTP diphosphatase
LACPHNQEIFVHSDINLTNPPGRRIGALALIRNEHGAVLMVKPSYRDRCILPGGGAHRDEPVHEACAREVAEETGLTDFEPGRLLLVDYNPRNQETGVVEGCNLVFDAGILSSATEITLREPEAGEVPELTAHHWVQPYALDTFTEPYQESRVRMALAVLDGFRSPPFLREGKLVTADNR